MGDYKGRTGLSPPAAYHLNRGKGQANAKLHIPENHSRVHEEPLHLPDKDVSLPEGIANHHPKLNTKLIRSKHEKVQTLLMIMMNI